MRTAEIACELHQQALARLDAGDVRGAKRLLGRALVRFERMGASARADVANVLVELAGCDRTAGKLAEARSKLERCSILLRGRVGREVGRLRARVGSDLALVLVDLGLFVPALRVARRASRIAARLPAADRAPVFNTLGITCKYTGRIAEGLAAYRRATLAARRACPNNSLFFAVLEHNIGGIHHAGGDFRRAEPHSRRAVELRASQLGPDHPDVLADEAALAAVLDGLGRWDEAEAIHKRVIAQFSAQLGNSHPEVAHAIGNYAAHLQLRGLANEAARQHLRAISLKRRALGEDHPSTASERVHLAILELGRSRPSTAEPLLSAALASYVAQFGERHHDTKECRALLCECRVTAS